MYQYRAKLDRVIDGDTMDFILDLGFHIEKKVRIRVAGIDTPEIRGPEREHGLIFKALAQTILEEAGEILVTTGKDVSFNRWIGDISVDGVDYCDLLGP